MDDIERQSATMMVGVEKKLEDKGKCIMSLDPQRNLHTFPIFFKQWLATSWATNCPNLLETVLILALKVLCYNQIMQHYVV